MVILSPEQRRAIGEAGNQPVPIIDPETQQTYLIIKAQVYDRLRASLEEKEIDPSFFEIRVQQAFCSSAGSLASAAASCRPARSVSSFQC